MIKLDKEKKTFLLLCLLPILAFFSIGFYSSPTISRAVLLVESGVFFLLFLLNLSLIRGWQRWGAIAASLISVFVTLLSHSGIGIALSFFNLLVSILLFNNLAISKKRKKLLHLLSAAPLLLLYLISNVGVAGGGGAMLDFSGYSLNPNVVGMLWLAVFFHAFCYVNLMKISKIKRLMCLCACTVISACVICLTGCRSAIISLVIFLGLLWLCRLYKGEIPYSHYKTASLVILCSSLLFTFVYVRLSHRFDDVTVLGKELFTGREIVWQSAYGLISESFLFGNGTDLLLDTVEGAKTTSAHNMLLSFWYTLGFVPTLIVTVLFVNRVRNKSEYKRDRVTQVALISSLFICFFESFLADSSLQIFFSLFLISNICKEEAE